MMHPQSMYSQSSDDTTYNGARTRGLIAGRKMATDELIDEIADAGDGGDATAQHFGHIRGLEDALAERKHQASKMKFAIRWKNGGTIPAVERVTFGGFDTPAEAISRTLENQRKGLERARESVAAIEGYVARLEKMLAKEAQHQEARK